MCLSLIWLFLCIPANIASEVHMRLRQKQAGSSFYSSCVCLLTDAFRAGLRDFGRELA